MKQAVRKLVVAAVVAGLSVGSALAQTYTAPAPTTPKATGAPTSQTNIDLEQAQAKCNTLTGNTEKAECQAKVKAAYEAPQRGQSSSGQSGATSGSASGSAGTGGSSESGSNGK